MRDPVRYGAAVLAAVGEFTARGQSTFACRPDKSPYTKGGFKVATLDSEQLRRAFTTHPDALIGLPTGKGNKLFVVDLDYDQHKGVDGDAWFREQVRQHGDLPRGPVAKTPRGGRHVYFRYPDDRVVKCSAGKIATGVDVRGDGGYVITPPSESDAGIYEWETPLDGVELPDAPEWLLTLVCEAPPKDELAELDDNVPTTGADLALTGEVIEQHLAKVRSARPGTRNTTLNAAAFFCGKLVGAGVAREADVSEMLAAAARQSGLTSEEAARTIRSGVNAGKRRPWRPRAASMQLNQLNAEYFLALDGKTALIFREESDPITGNRKLDRLYVSAFMEILSNRSIKAADGKIIPLGVAWRRWASRRQYEKVTFLPGQELPANLYNQWHGFAAEPAAGECGRFLGYMRDVLCNGDLDCFAYLLGWSARAVQQPSRQGEVAVVLRGRKGTGKSFYGRHLGELFGEHYVTMADSRHLVGNFNAHLETAIIVFADEAFWAGDKQGEGVLKTIITEPFIRIERKGIDSKNAPNYTHLIMASNSDWVVPASHDERRYFMLDVSDVHREDHDYFAAIENASGARRPRRLPTPSPDARSFRVQRSTSTADGGVARPEAPQPTDPRSMALYEAACGQD